MRFQDRVVLITGGNSGIGLATAKRFAHEGAKVLITGRDEGKLKGAAQEIGNGTSFYRIDVARIEELDRLFSQVKVEYGRIDVLFANAGVAIFAPTDHFSSADFDTLINTNFKGVFFTIQKALPLMQSGASVVVNASVGSSKGIPNGSVYNATKAAIRSLVRTFTAEHVAKGLRFNVVSPGPIETPIFERTEGLPVDLSAWREQLASMIPVKRLGTAEEVAAAVAFLASNEASYISGVELFVDGAMTQV